MGKPQSRTTEQIQADGADILILKHAATVPSVKQFAEISGVPGAIDRVLQRIDRLQAIADAAHPIQLDSADTDAGDYSRAWALVLKAANDGDPEQTLIAIAGWLAVDRDHQTDATLRALLDSAAEGCRHAAMDYYASTK